jgi:F0F1-type ATP synthase assembly protein I
MVEETDGAGGNSSAGSGEGGGRWLGAAKYLAIGVEFPSMVAGGLFIGYFLDGRFAAFPLWTTVCALLALAAAFLRLVQWARMSNERRDRGR